MSELKQDVIAYAKAGGTESEIANLLGISFWQFQKEYGEAFRRASAQMKIRLRSRQIEEALNGDQRMLIHLSKQYLAAHGPAIPPGPTEEEIMADEVLRGS